MQHQVATKMVPRRRLTKRAKDAKKITKKNFEKTDKNKQILIFLQ